MFATGTTGTRIMSEVGLTLFRYKSGPLGGDQQIGSAIANNEMDMVIFSEIHLLRNHMSQMFLL